MGLFQYEWLLRLVCSVAVGTLIGYERHVRSKDAGIRTHAIVALASCLMMLIYRLLLRILNENASRQRWKNLLIQTGLIIRS